MCVCVCACACACVCVCVPQVIAECWRPQKGERSFWINTLGRSWVGLTVTSRLSLAANAPA